MEFPDSAAPRPARCGAVDLCKALSICAVVLIHCGANSLAYLPVGSGGWLGAAVWGCAARWAVPAFLMCSGALMNDPARELSLRRLFTRYLPRLALSLAVWAALYEALHVFFGPGSAPLGELLARGAKNWLTGDTYYHLYYFYLVMALYLALPLTRLIVRGARRAEAAYLTALWLVAGSLIPFLQYFFPFLLMGPSLLRFILPGVFFAPGLGLLGWYLRQADISRRWVPTALFAAGLMVTLGGTWRRSAAAGCLDQVYLDAFNPFPLLMAAGIFLLARQSTQGRTLPRGVRLMSQGSFCIYLVHPFFLSFTAPLFEGLHPLWAAPVQAAMSIGLSLAVYLVLRRVPFVSRWLI